MNKKKISLAVILCLFLFLSVQKISAIEFLDLKISSYATVIQNNQPVFINQDTTIKNTETIKLHFNLSNKSGKTSVNVHVQEKEGMVFLAYYYGVMTIDNVAVSSDEYAQFMSSGLSLFLDKKPTQISLDVQNDGMERNQIALDLIVNTASVEIGNNQEIFENRFQAHFVESQTKHNVRFYDGKQLFMQFDVEDQTSLDTSKIYKEGFNLESISYQDTNTKYLGEPITKATSFQLQFERKQFVVSYYVDNELYHRELVEYEKDAPNISCDYKNFNGWSGNLKRIKTDTNIYAILTANDIVSPLSVQYSLFNRIDGRNTIIFFDRMNQNGMSTDGNLNFDKISHDKTEKVITIDPQRISISLIPLLLATIFMIYVERKKRKERRL